MKLNKRKIIYKHLVHIVNHTDVFFSIQNESRHKNYIARPKFDRFKECTEILANALKDESNCKPIQIPAKFNKGLFPVGFEFINPIRNISYEMINIRDFDFKKKQNSDNKLGNCLVVQIFLPLIAIIIPYWLSLYYETEVT